MKRKKVFYTEMAYGLGIILLAMGTALMEKADFGMSMVVAPAYLLYLKLSQSLEWFTFGMAEYGLQAVILLLMSVVVKKFKPMYLFSFCTAVLYGFVLDVWLWLAGFIPDGGTVSLVVFYLSGLFLCSVGVAMLFHTYLAPEAYELLVKEISAQFQINIAVTKTVYDCCSCLLAIVMSFAFFGFGHFEGVKLGTVICALVNGWLIGKIGYGLERHFDFRDKFERRKWFS